MRELNIDRLALTAEISNNSYNEGLLPSTTPISGGYQLQATNFTVGSVLPATSLFTGFYAQ